MSTTEDIREGFYLSEGGEWIPDGWSERPLSQLTTKIGSGATPRGGKDAYKAEGISLIRSQNIHDLKFAPNGLAFIDDEQAQQLSNVEIEEDDVLINITGDSVARACKVPSFVLPARVNQHVAIIRADRAEAHPRYLEYLLVARANKGDLLGLASAGATRNALTKGMLEDFTRVVPHATEQKAIADVLGSLDDKIELLREQNETLEALAQTLFKRWFIDFNFPDENNKPYKDSGGVMIASELGEIPEGWRCDGLTAYLDVMGGGTPKTSIKEYWKGDYFFFTPKDATNSFFCLTTEKSVTQSGIDNSSTKLFPVNTIFVTARGTVGKTALAHIPMAMNQSCYALKEKNGCSFAGFLLLRAAIHKLQKYACGGVFDAITTSTLGSTVMAYPDGEFVSRFEEEVTPLFLKNAENSKQIKTLTELRDTLLPKLMKGEVRIQKADMPL